MKRVSNRRLEELSKNIMAETAGMAEGFLQRRRAAGEAPNKCESCGRRATKMDNEGVPLCGPCYRRLAEQNP